MGRTKNYIVDKQQYSKKRKSPSPFDSSDSFADENIVRTSTPIPQHETVQDVNEELIQNDTSEFQIANITSASILNETHDKLTEDEIAHMFLFIQRKGKLSDKSLNFVLQSFNLICPGYIFYKILSFQRV